MPLTCQHPYKKKSYFPVDGLDHQIYVSCEFVVGQGLRLPPSPAESSLIAGTYSSLMLDEDISMMFTTLILGPASPSEALLGFRLCASTTGRIAASMASQNSSRSSLETSSTQAWKAP